MTDFSVREYRKPDIPALTALWHEVFGDSEEFVSGFLRLLPEMGTGAVAELEGTVVGAAYAITGLMLGGTPVGYIYAVAVSENARHRGIGEAVTQMARKLAIERGAGIVCTLPAEAGLYAWYERIIGTQHRLRRHVTELICKPVCALYPLSAGEYMAKRENLLAGKPHLVPCNAAMEFEDVLCRTYGGGLFGGEHGICAVLRDGGTAYFHELIADGRDMAELAQSVGAHLGCETARFFTVSDAGEDYIASDVRLPKDCGFTFSFE